ncbi:tetratricopeptide repeat protein [Candidatus Calescamantes bacterium]|nr:tetratricopeptide repeat protein [Candidatus Calescamantes bacterium]
MRYVFILLLISFSTWLFPMEEKPFSAWAHFLASEIYRWQGKKEKGLEELQKAYKEDPSSLYLKERLSYLLLKQGKREEAQILLEELQKEEGDKKSVYLMLSLLYSQNGEEKKSLRIMNKAFRKFPHDPEILLGLVEKYLRLKMRKKAEVLGNKLLLLSPSSEYLTSLGILYLTYGMEKKGEEILLRVVNKDLKNYRALLSLGTYYEMKKKLEKAKEFYKRCLELNPFSPFLYFRIAAIDMERRDWEEALSLYKVILLLRPKNTLALQQIAFIYLQKGKYEEAKDILLKIESPSFYTFYLLASVEFERGNLKEAEEWAGKAKKNNPKFPEVYALLASIKERDGKKRKAESILLEALEKFSSPSKKSQVYLSLGLLYQELGKRDKSIQSFSRAKELSPDWDAPYFYLGAAYERKGSWVRAVYNLRKAIELNPHNADALNYLGYMFADKGVRLKDAHKLIEKALKLEPENAYYIDSLGWVFYRLGRLEDALREIKKSLQLLSQENKDDAIIREHLGDIYFAMGKEKEAIKAWRRALELDPENKEVKKKIEKASK